MLIDMYITCRTLFKQMKFESLNQLEIELFDYINWYHNFWPHSSLQLLFIVNYIQCNRRVICPFF
ncbi:IS3 family transposase [Macrococcoides caseolyticum]|nr:IS3 family transposase [Macrococcus caseolyticus]